jgi:hypothetical protein
VYRCQASRRQGCALRIKRYRRMRDRRDRAEPELAAPENRRDSATMRACARSGLALAGPSSGMCLAEQGRVPADVASRFVRGPRRMSSAAKKRAGLNGQPERYDSNFYLVPMPPVVTIVLARANVQLDARAAPIVAVVTVVAVVPQLTVLAVVAMPVVTAVNLVDTACHVRSCLEVTRHSAHRRGLRRYYEEA